MITNDQFIEIATTVIDDIEFQTKFKRVSYSGKYTAGSLINILCTVQNDRFETIRLEFLNPTKENQDNVISLICVYSGDNPQITPVICFDTDFTTGHIQTQAADFSRDILKKVSPEQVKHCGCDCINEILNKFIGAQNV